MAPVVKIRTQSVPVKWHHTQETKYAFGHKNADGAFQLGIGGGYHDPIGRREHRPLHFTHFVQQWTDPATSLPGHARFAPRSEGNRVLPPSKAEMFRKTFGEFGRQEVPPIPMGRLADGRSACQDDMMQIERTFPPKTLAYPNPSNWKRSTSLPTRPPGFVGRHATR
mmetsp:Transcript_20239/g.47253  ORF Transcript_20239/g.47253 Transcript_20239/m.47253 type:complete len:167 (+) Transcript_20239:110-610(+)